MPSEVGELPSWFNMVENVWEKFEVPDDLKAKLLMPKLTPHAKSLIVRLSLDEQDTYETLRDFLLKQYQLGSREYCARFMHAGKSLVKLGFLTRHVLKISFSITPSPAKFPVLMSCLIFASMTNCQVVFQCTC